MTLGEKIIGFIDLVIETLFLPLAPLMGTDGQYPQSPHAQKLVEGWKEEWKRKHR